MKRAALLISRALPVVLLCAQVATGADPIDPLRQAEREARAKYANALGKIAKAVKAGEDLHKIVPLQETARKADATARDAAPETQHSGSRNQSA